MTATFLASLRVMGLGMLGIFSLAIALILVILLLGRLSCRRDDKNGQSAEEAD